MNNQHFSHAVAHVFKESDKLAPFRPGLNPKVGFLCGFLGGPLGGAAYTHSINDFWIMTAIVVAGTVMTAGIGLVPLWLCCGAWTAIRIRHSNDAHRRSAPPPLPGDVSGSSSTPPRPQEGA